MNENDYARAMEVKRRVEDDLLRLPGVHGVSVEPKRTGGRETGRAAIVVFVTRKRSGAELPAPERIPSEIDGVPTDVVESEQPAAH